ncbi:hypothetical protein WICPIJ_007352 [Wickerhamomyces pijperi]|uniref:Dienelactone hydrolase domain-containing protein n=1 Tax=Wickerhamomyces pijperi TaxID=599730 RepID=A0A9P8Q0E3_WICPI|nr:hypothetical protein WICPIJ_007352 [Wickerhamomyces pijperi]
MASNAPGVCCTKIDALHEGTPAGSLISLYNNESVYVTGEKQSSKVIVIATDIFGNHLQNVKLIADAFAAKGYYALHEDLKPEFVGLIGYCFGAKFVAQQLTETGYGSVGALAHPSFVTIEEVAAIKKPVIISAAEVDSIFTRELRYQTEEKLVEIGADFQIDLFAAKGKITHGFAVRGDISDKDIKHAKEQAFQDQLAYFEHYNKA